MREGERNISVRETLMWERKISCLPYAPWPGMEPTTCLVYKMMLQTWATQEGSQVKIWIIFNTCSTLFTYYSHYFLYLISTLTIRTSTMHFCYFESFNLVNLLVIYSTSVKWTFFRVGEIFRASVEMRFISVAPTHGWCGTESTHLFTLDMSYRPSSVSCCSVTHIQNPDFYVFMSNLFLPESLGILYFWNSNCHPAIGQVLLVLL